MTAGAHGSAGSTRSGPPFLSRNSRYSFLLAVSWLRRLKTNRPR